MHIKKDQWLGRAGIGWIVLLLAGCGVDSPTGPAPGPVAKSAAPATPQAQVEPVPKVPVKPAEKVKPEVPEAANPTVAAPTKPRGVATEVDMTTFFAWREAGKALVYDVRPGFHFRMGHIPGAVSFPRLGFDRHFPEQKANLDAAVAAGKKILVYCTDVDCPDGGAVARRLAEHGYSVSVFKGGWQEWKAAGLPTE